MKEVFTILGHLDLKFEIEDLINEEFGSLEMAMAACAIT